MNLATLEHVYSTQETGRIPAENEAHRTAEVHGRQALPSSMRRGVRALHVI